MKVVIHGNCQSAAMRFLIRGFFPKGNVQALEVHKCPVDAAMKTEYASWLKEADVVLYQPVAETYRGADFLGNRFVTENARPGATVACYPSIYYHGYLQGYVLPDKAGGVVGYRNASLPFAMVQGVVEAQGDPAILERVQDPDLLPLAAVAAYHAECLGELQRREKEADVLVPVSGLIEESRFEKKLFHTVNHPSRFLLARLTNAIFKELALDVVIKEDGPDPLAFTRVPCLPTVARTFRETPDESHYFADGKAMSRDAFYGACLEVLRSYPPELAAKAYASYRARWETMRESGAPVS